MSTGQLGSIVGAFKEDLGPGKGSGELISSEMGAGLRTSFSAQTTPKRKVKYQIKLRNHLRCIKANPKLEDNYQKA